MSRSISRPTTSEPSQAEGFAVVTAPGVVVVVTRTKVDVEVKVSMIDCESGFAGLDIWLPPDEATKLANALTTAANGIEVGS